MPDVNLTLALASAVPGRPVRAIPGSSVGLRIRGYDSQTGQALEITGVAAGITSPVGVSTPVVMTRVGIGDWTGQAVPLSVGYWMVDVSCSGPNVEIVQSYIDCQNEDVPASAAENQAAGSAFNSAERATAAAATAASAGAAAGDEAGRIAGAEAGTTAGAEAGTIAGTSAGTAAGTAAGAAAGTAAGIAAAEPFAVAADGSRQSAETAAANATASVANAAPNFATWAEVTAWVATAADRAIAVLTTADAGRVRGQYRKVGGVAVWESDTLPGVDERLGKVGVANDDDVTASWRLKDLIGFIGLELSADGKRLRGAFGVLGVDDAGIPTLSAKGGSPIIQARAGGGAVVGGTEIWSDDRSDVAFTMQDLLGFWGWAMSPLGAVLSAGGDSTSGFSADDVADEDQLARLLAAERLRETDVTSARPADGYNHINGNGQSLNEGWDASAISTVPPYASNLTLGNHVHSTGGETWVPNGAAVFKPLVETTTTYNGGETVMTQALSFLKFRMSDQRGTAEDTARKLVATTTGFGGRTLEMLSKGASPNEYGRNPSVVAQVRDAAISAGGAYQMLAEIYQGNEYNYTGTNGGSTDKAAYKTGLKKLMSDKRADCQIGIAGQTRPFAVFTSYPGAQYTVDETHMSIAMAHWELSEEEPNWYLVGGFYPYPDVGGHVTGNAQAWHGQQFGKVLDRVLLRSERWRPLVPIAAKRRGLDVLVSFHVPAPPLVFRSCYVQLAATMFANKGFAALDSAGVVPIVSVEIAAPTVIHIKLGRNTSMVAAPALRYAGMSTFSGHGNVADSDTTVATAKYVYDPAIMTAGENIPELVGRPYPLWNWLIPHEIPIIDA